MGDVDTLWRWIDSLVEVLREHGKPMNQDEAMRRTAALEGVALVRMPYVVQNAIAEKLVKRGGLGQWDMLSLVEYPQRIPR
jgi:hypothetical protein